VADENLNPYGDEPANPAAGTETLERDRPNPYGDTPVNVEKPKPETQSTTPDTDKAFMDAITVTAPYKPPPSGLSRLYHAITPPEGFSVSAWLRGKVTPEQKAAAEVPGGKFSVEDWAAGRTTPGVPASPVKEALGAMIMGQLKQPSTREIMEQQAFGPLAPYVENVNQAFEKYQKGASREEVARTLSPEYGMIQDIRNYPVGSKEWWSAFIPLSIETAQYAAPFLGPAGRALMGKPIFKPPPGAFRFPVTEPGAVAREVPGVTMPGPKGFVTPAEGAPPAPPPTRTMTPAEFRTSSQDYINKLKASRSLDAKQAEDLKAFQEAERSGDWSQAAKRFGIDVEAPKPPTPPPTPSEAEAPPPSQEDQDAIIRRLMEQGRTEEEARLAARAGETGRPRIREGGIEIGRDIPPAPPRPAPFEVDDIVTDEETRGRIKHAEEMPDGGWKIHFDTDQIAILYPDQPGAYRIARVAPFSSTEGTAIRTGRSVEEIQRNVEEINRRAAEASYQRNLDAARSRRELEEERQDASKKRRTAQVVFRGEGGGMVPETPFRHPGETPPIRPQKPIPTTKPVAPTPPEPADVERGAGAAVEEKATALTKPPDIGDKIIWRKRPKTVTDYNPTSGTVTFTDDETGQVHRAPFNPNRMRGVPKARPAEIPKGPLTEAEKADLGIERPRPRPKASDPLWEEAVKNVNKRLGVPKDPAERASRQAEGILDSNEDLNTYYKNEHEALKAKYGGEEEAPSEPQAGRKVLASANVGAHGGEEARVAAIRRAVREGTPPPGWEGNQADWNMYLNLLGGGVETESAGKLIREPLPKAGAKGETRAEARAEARAEHKEVAKEVIKETGKEEGKEAGKSLRDIPPTRDPSEPPPIPVQYREPPPPRVTQAGMAGRIEDAYRRLHSSRVISEASPSEGLSKNEVIEGGRAAMRAGVDPIAVAKSDNIRADLKYGVMRAHGEDLREHAISLEREARANPSQANTARANEAFSEYSNWDTDVLKQKEVANAELLKRGVEGIEEEPDLQNMVDARREFVKTYGRDWEPQEKARVQKAIDQVEQANKSRSAADQGYSRQLEQAAPNPEFEIKNKEELNNAVSQIMKRIFPCS